MGRSRCAAAFVGATLICCVAAWAQDNSKRQAEALKAQGQFLRGAAWYELNSSKARAVDAKTAKAIYEWNREVYDDYRKARAERLGARKNLTKAQQEQAKRDMEEKEVRLRTSPTSDDIVRGDALNAVVVDLSDPAITEAQWRYAKVPLPEGISIRTLVFQYVPNMKAGAGTRTSAGLLALGRLDAAGHWPLYLPANKLAKERTDYEAAYRTIRDQCLHGELNIESVDRLDRAIDALKAKAATEVPAQRGYRAYAARFVDDIRSSAQIFDAGTVALAQELIVDTQYGRDAQTVGELLAFMRKYRLLFASAEQRPEDTDNYRKLYSLLRQQKDALGLTTPTASTGPGQSPVPPAVASRIPPLGPARRAGFTQGNWSVEGDQLIKEGLATGQVAFGNPGWTDFDLSFEVRKTAGAGGMGAHFRTSRIPNDQKCYVLIIGDASKQHLLHAWSKAGNRVAELSAKPGVLPPGDWHKVTISARGPRIRAALDDEPLFAVTSNHSPGGTIALKCWDCAGRFRKIKVTAVDGTVLWEGPPQLAGKE